MKKLAIVSLMAAMVPVVFADTGAPAADAPAVLPDYEAAARFAPSRLQKMVGSISVSPTWLKSGDRFWYIYSTGQGKTYYLVDPAQGRQAPLFDHDAVAAQLTLTIRDAFDAKNLPLENIEFLDGDRKMRFEVKSSQTDEEEKKKEEAKAKAKSEAQEKEAKEKGIKKKPKAEEPKKEYKKLFTFEYDLAARRLTHLVDYKKPKDDPSWANFSPDEQKVLYAKGYDLYWMDAANLQKAKEDEDDATIVEHRLTEDGVAGYDYSTGSFGSRTKSNEDQEERAKKRVRAGALWSRNSNQFALVRYDQRKVSQLWVVDPLAKPRPVLETYAYAMPGEEEVGQTELWVFDIAAGKKTAIDVKAFKDQDLSILPERQLKKNRADKRQPVKWMAAAPDELHLYRLSRDLKRIDFVRVNVNTGESKVLVEERFNTANDYKTPWLVNGGREVIFWSERDGWAHLYLYDDQGRMKNAITGGTFHAFDVEGLDEKNRVLYFSAVGRESGQNPYYKHLYRVNLDGTGLRMLDSGNFDNGADVSDSTGYFVNNYSRVDTAPRSDLRDTSGKLVMNLQEADLSRLMSAGYKFPETFTVKADDGVTDLYGVMYKPFNFDPSRKYPIITWVYPGPQTESVDSSFQINMTGRANSPAMHLPALAQFGYIVVTVGNRGGHPTRSRVYQDFSYKASFRDYGLADKKTALEQLASRYSFIDIDRVGITGHSGGGFMSTAAMLVYPDFFKVAVSSSGNHTNTIYNRWWSERYSGVDENTDDKGNTTYKVSLTENADLAKNLKGHLMLVTGEVDNNVHPANTYRMVEALIQAGKRFDMLVIPSAAHGFMGAAGDYFFWRRADYFNKYLLGWAPDGADMVDMAREYPATKK